MGDKNHRGHRSALWKLRLLPQVEKQMENHDRDMRHFERILLADKLRIYQRLMRAEAEKPVRRPLQQSEQELRVACTGAGATGR